MGDDGKGSQAAGVVPLFPSMVRSPTHIVEMDIKTPCLNCLTVGVYRTHHLADAVLAEKVASVDLSGEAIHELAYQLEHFSPHRAFGRCPTCGRIGTESSSIGLERLSSVDFAGVAHDAAYEYLSISVKALADG